MKNTIIETVLVLGLASLVLCEDTSEKITERHGIYNSGYTEGTLTKSEDAYNESNYHTDKAGYTHVQTVTEQVPVPVPQPYQVTVNRPVPVLVPKYVPVDVPRPVKVMVPKPYPVIVHKPYPVYIHRPVPVAVPHPIRVPVAEPYEVPIPQPYPVEMTRYYPVKVPQKYYLQAIQPVYLGGLGYTGYENIYGYGNVRMEREPYRPKQYEVTEDYDNSNKYPRYHRHMYTYHH